jgi:hypothetical protein
MAGCRTMPTKGPNVLRSKAFACRYRLEIPAGGTANANKLMISDPICWHFRRTVSIDANKSLYSLVYQRFCRIDTGLLPLPLLSQYQH